MNAHVARWLLTARGRVLSNKFRLTHEFLGEMQGIRRVGVTNTASALQKPKLISPEFSIGRVSRQLLAAAMTRHAAWRADRLQAGACCISGDSGNANVICRP